MRRTLVERFAVAAAVAGTLVLVVVAVILLRDAERAADELRLDASVDAVATVFRVELERLADAGVDAGVALALAGPLDQETYGTLLEQLAIESRFPGVYGVSFIERVERQDLPAFLDALRVRQPDVELIDDAGEELLRIITFSYPIPENAAAIGVDLTSRSDSRRTADRAVQTGLPALSNATQIIQLGETEPGAVIHAPVQQRAGEPAATVGMVFSVQRFLERLEPLPLDVDIAVTDPDAVTFSEVAEIGRFDPAASLTAEAPIEAVGQRWTVVGSAGPGFVAPWTARASTWTAIAGLLVAVLVGLFTRSLVARERLASELVDERTFELSAVNDRLELSNAALADANRAKDEFLASVSHELRTPLTVIAGFVESMQRMPADQVDVTAFLEPIGRNVRRLDTLVGDLLTLVSLDAGAVTAFRQPVDLRALLPDAPRVLAGLEDGVEVQVRTHRQVVVDPRHLERILVNLLVNAQRHGAPPVELHASDGADGTVEIRVRDHGLGIPHEQLDALFERFARGAGSRRVTGTGLGLAIVRELVELNGGDITYEDGAPGACFVVRFEAAAGFETAAEPA